MREICGLLLDLESEVRSLSDQKRFHRTKIVVTCNSLGRDSHTYFEETSLRLFSSLRTESDNEGLEGFARMDCRWLFVSSLIVET